MTDPPDHEEVPSDQLFPARSTLVGRLLCRLGLHSWDHGTMVDQFDDAADNFREFKVTDWSWCRRPGCDERTHKVNVENRRFTLR